MGDGADRVTVYNEVGHVEPYGEKTVVVGGLYRIGKDGLLIYQTIIASPVLLSLECQNGAITKTSGRDVVLRLAERLERVTEQEAFNRGRGLQEQAGWLLSRNRN